MHAPLELVTILLLGHNGLLRSGELMSGLQVSDITWDSPRAGFSLVLLRSNCRRSGPRVLVNIQSVTKHFLKISLTNSLCVSKSAGNF